MAPPRKNPQRKRSTAVEPDQTNTESAMTGAASTLVGLAQQLRSWTDSVLGIAGAAADVTLGAAKMVLPKPEQRQTLEKTGAVLRRMREAAGMSVDEVGDAINLKDPALLELVENGKLALPFEIILRLASVLGRNDPISFVMRFTRSYNPEVWKTLETLGIGRLALQAGAARLESVPPTTRCEGSRRTARCWLSSRRRDGPGISCGQGQRRKAQRQGEIDLKSTR
jgi:transcriptional regulator with XRE-family HTH domain